MHVSYTYIHIHINKTKRLQHDMTLAILRFFLLNPQTNEPYFGISENSFEREEKKEKKKALNKDKGLN